MGKEWGLNPEEPYGFRSRAGVPCSPQNATGRGGKGCCVPPPCGSRVRYPPHPPGGRQQAGAQLWGQNTPKNLAAIFIWGGGGGVTPLPMEAKPAYGGGGVTIPCTTRLRYKCGCYPIHTPGGGIPLQALQRWGALEARLIWGGGNTHINPFHTGSNAELRVGKGAEGKGCPPPLSPPRAGCGGSPQRRAGRGGAGRGRGRWDRGRGRGRDAAGAGTGRTMRCGALALLCALLPLCPAGLDPPEPGSGLQAGKERTGTGQRRGGGGCERPRGEVWRGPHTPPPPHPPAHAGGGLKLRAPPRSGDARR